MKVKKPTLIIDKEKSIANLQSIHEKAVRSGVRFRPHFKTHQSAIIGNWFRKFGIHSITVSTVTMGKFFSNYGWKDITLSLPVNTLEAYEINELAFDVDLNIVVESAEPVRFLNGYLTHKVGVFIEIDTGDHRTGLSGDDTGEIHRILDILRRSSRLRFKGFCTHSGQTYHAENKEMIRKYYLETVEKMSRLKEIHLSEFPEMIISVGDTPSASIIEDFSGVDEIRPGNFIFYDLMQYSIGACSIDQVAVALACPVIAKNDARNEVVVYGGAAHLSKEFLYRSDGDRTYGYVVAFGEKRWTRPIKGAYLAKITQDHGIIKGSDTFVQGIKRGDIVGILPVHSCLTANLMKRYMTLEGEAIDY